MSQSSINLISGAVHSIDNPDLLLRVTGVISLFIQTMEVRTFWKTMDHTSQRLMLGSQNWQFHSSGMNSFLMTLFERYLNLLKRRQSDDFQEVCLLYLIQRRLV